MEKRHLGTSDVQITPILMGTWQAGKRMWTGIEDADSIKAIRTAYEVLPPSIQQRFTGKDIPNGLLPQL
jgi:hypothetical protein